jgi:nicotinate-nucleotide pyrophosphorylase (carboxylating)
MKMLSEAKIDEAIACALAEDLARGDITTDILISPGQQGIADIVAKEAGILTGAGLAKRTFLGVDSVLKVDVWLADGSELNKDDVIASVEGNVASILRAERVALNFLQWLSGIATQTNRYVKIVQGLPVQILDTRKTTPGLRSFEKYAVRMGGGVNHRMSLADGVLIKDNHLEILRHLGMTVNDVAIKTRQDMPCQMKIEIEVGTLQEVHEALEAGVDIIMLDNMTLEDMRQAVEIASGRVLLEASGGITLDKVRSVAETGVNFISIGALTHSFNALDINLSFNLS